MYRFIQLANLRKIPLPLYIVAIGLNHNPGNYESAHGHANYQLICCTQGEGTVTIDGCLYNLKEGIGCLVEPGHAYAFHYIKDHWKLDFFEFNGPVASTLLQMMNISVSACYAFVDYNIFHRHLLKIYWMYKQVCKPDILEFSTECYRILLNLPNCTTSIVSRKLQTESGKEENMHITRILAFLEENYAHMITLEEISESIHLNKQYMCTLFKKKIGHTIFTELTYIRLGHARLLLRQYPEKNLKDISRMCGFSDAGYFGKVFKRYIAMTPNEYRV